MGILGQALELERDLDALLRRLEGFEGSAESRVRPEEVDLPEIESS